MIETERMFLRELALVDVEALSLVLSDEESMMFYPHPFSRTEVERWVLWNITNYQEHGFGLWAVILKESGELIGDCGITMQDIEGELLPEIGYHIRKDQCRRGLATEAAAACLDFAFRVRNFPLVCSYMDVRNMASRKVAEKNGMVFCKTFTKAIADRYVEEALYVRTRDMDGSRG